MPLKSTTVLQVKLCTTIQKGKTVGEKSPVFFSCDVVRHKLTIDIRVKL